MLRNTGLFAGVLACLLLAACGDERAPETTNSTEAQAFVQATAGSSAATPVTTAGVQGPLHIAKPTLVLREKRGAIGATVLFRIENPSDQAVAVNDIVTWCGCTTPGAAPKAIAAGKVLELPVKVDFKKVKKETKRYVALQVSDEAGNAHEYILTVVVLPAA